MLGVITLEPSGAASAKWDDMLTSVYCEKRNTGRECPFSNTHGGIVIDIACVIVVCPSQRSS
jgi:hypothetical protein